MPGKWYTARGDDGYTGVLGRGRVPKYDKRPDAYGTVDEASAVLGLARAQARDERVRSLLLVVQRDLYNLMADLATVSETATRPPWLAADRLAWLEQMTDELGAGVAMPPAFIVPGDSIGGATLEIARTVVRRSERLVVRLAHAGQLQADTPLKYLNRLSSLLFVLARLEDKAEGVEEFTLADGNDTQDVKRIRKGAPAPVRSSITFNYGGRSMLKDLVFKTRSYRRFHEDIAVQMDTLRELVDLARLSASGANRQPLKFVLSCDRETNAAIYPSLAWAAYLKDWAGPVEGERPSAYIVILGDTTISRAFGVDHGIAAQSIMLGATERGLGGCIIASVKHDLLRAVLDIPARYQILLVLALGAPKEGVVVDPVGPDGDIKYWRDEAGVHHVPKRRLEELIVGERG